MIDRIVDSKNIIHKALDAAALRNDVISENIANVDTPGYKKKKVVFEELLRAEMGYSNGKDSNKNLPDIKVVEEQGNHSFRLDENNVDIDVEMTELAKNSIRYNVLAELSGYSRTKMVLNQTK